MNLSYSGLIHVEQVEDYVKYLTKENDSQIKMIKEMKVKSYDSSLLSLKSAAAGYILNLCDFWKLSAEVKFVAVEMYHQFIVNLLNEIFKTVFNDSKKLKDTMKKRYYKETIEKPTPTVTQSNQWNETVQHIIGQMELRAVSCVTIASKFVSNCLHVTNNMAIKFLALGRHKYTSDTLLKSEIRILKTLKFNIASLSTALPYICAFADLITKKELCCFNKEVFDSAIELLFCFYTCSDKVYEKYLKALRKENNAKEPCKTMSVSLLSKDLVLLSCGAIAAASFVCSKQNSDNVIKALSEITLTSQDLIAKFSCILLEETLN